MGCPSVPGRSAGGGARASAGLLLSGDDGVISDATW